MRGPCSEMQIFRSPRVLYCEFRCKMLYQGVVYLYLLSILRLTLWVPAPWEPNLYLFKLYLFKL